MSSCSLADRRAKEGETEEGAGAGAKRRCTANANAAANEKKHWSSKLAPVPPCCLLSAVTHSAFALSRKKQAAFTSSQAEAYKQMTKKTGRGLSERKTARGIGVSAKTNHGEERSSTPTALPTTKRLPRPRPRPADAAAFLPRRGKAAAFAEAADVFRRGGDTSSSSSGSSFAFLFLDLRHDLGGSSKGNDDDCARFHDDTGDAPHGQGGCIGLARRPRQAALGQQQQ